MSDEPRGTIVQVMQDGFRELVRTGIGADFLLGEWTHRNPMSIPGAAYSTCWNTRSYGALAADRTGIILCDPDGSEILWRQPETTGEWNALVAATRRDDVNSYQVDGLEHWSAEGVVEWEATELPKLVMWVNDPEALDSIVDWTRGNCHPDEVRRRVFAWRDFYADGRIHRYLNQLTQALSG